MPTLYIYHNTTYYCVDPENIRCVIAELNLWEEFSIPKQYWTQRLTAEMFIKFFGCIEITRILVNYVAVLYANLRRFMIEVFVQSVAEIFFEEMFGISPHLDHLPKNTQFSQKVYFESRAFISEFFCSRNLLFDLRSLNCA